ncbi:MAG: hypothetical protein ABW220_19550 [Burkholderiaceae bacterium]
MKRVLWALAALCLLSLLLAGLALQGEARVGGHPPAEIAARVHQAKAALQRNDPRGGPPGPRQLRLAESELEWLLDLGLSRWRPAATQVRLAPGTADVTLSIDLPFPTRWRWLNIETQWRQSGTDALWPELAHARLGRLPLPAPLSGWLLHQAARRALGDEDLQLARGMLRTLTFGPQTADLRYDWQPQTAHRLAGRLWPAADQERFKVYQARIAVLSEPFPTGANVPMTPWLVDLLRLAGERSGGRKDEAAAEHRAAILTLGLYASGHAWGRFIPDARAWPQPRPLTLMLLRREDFTLHLLISAVIAIEGGGPVADAIGLYKEIADTRGGSGFSFNDLAADLAGKRLGLMAIQDPARLQRLAAVEVQDSDYMPSVEDLPEFLTEAQVQAEFGGAGGPGYRAMMDRIEQRVAALPWFR